jgi:hypothetical protein
MFTTFIEERRSMPPELPVAAHPMVEKCEESVERLQEFSLKDRKHLSNDRVRSVT